MKIRSLNNATSLLKNEDFNLLLDPWLIAKLYGGAWTPVINLDNLEFLNDVNTVFISHIHEDHWDYKTL